MDFPIYEPPKLNNDRVRAILYKLKTNGIPVHKFSDKDSFIIPISEVLSIRIFPVGSDGLCQNQSLRNNSPMQVENVSSEVAFEQSIDVMFNNLTGKGLNMWKPQSVRLTENQPASNLKKISNLIDMGAIEVVFDPYLDNEGLQSLADIISLCDGSIASNIRLLTSLTSPRITRTYVDNWFKEMCAAQGEIRKLPSSEHRRFMLLNNGQSLILGPSLNAISKNEVASRESDTEDRPFFDDIWSKSTPLI